MQFIQLQVAINIINVVTITHTGLKKKTFKLLKTTMNVTVQLQSRQVCTYHGCQDAQATKYPNIQHLSMGPWFAPCLLLSLWHLEFQDASQIFGNCMYAYCSATSVLPKSVAETLLIPNQIPCKEFSRSSLVPKGKWQNSTSNDL